MEKIKTRLDINCQHLWLLAVFAVILVGCGSRNKGATEVVFDRTVYEPQYASGFRILGNEESESYVIEVTDPWEGADSVTFRLLVLAEGEEVPDDFDGQVLKGKAGRIVAMSSTNVAMLDALGKTPEIVGISGKRFISSSNVKSRLADIADVGYEGQMDYEALIASRPDLVLLYGVQGASAMENKLRELGIPYLYVGDYLEESPLGKAEWVVAIAAVVSSVDEGVKVFSELPPRYNSLRDSLASLNLPPVKVLVNAPYADSWLLPPTGSYGSRLIADAGGKILTRGKISDNVIPVSREEALLIAGEADFWLNPGNVQSLGELDRLAPGFLNTGCVTKGGVFNNNRRSTPGGGNDYFESGVMHPDVILLDLVRIFHPERFPGPLYYYQRLE